MSRPVCDCGHEKRDHVMPSTVAKSYGQCKVCLCDAYARKADVPRRPAATMTDEAPAPAR